MSKAQSESTNLGCIRTVRASWLPSIGDLLYVAVLLLLFGILPNFLLFNDGSTGWHLVTGHFVLENMRVPNTDLISYTFPDQHWVAYEWLFDTVIAGLDKLGGLKLVATAAGSAIALLFFLLYGSCRKSGCQALLAVLLCFLGVLVSAVHWLVRPHLVTFFGVYIYSQMLERFWQGELSGKALFIWLAAAMLIWTNSHPAFIIGFVMVGIYLSCDLATTLLAGKEASSQAWARCKTLAAALAASLAASLLNPYGLKLYSYIFDYLTKTTSILKETEEYNSPVFHGTMQPACLELLFFSLAVALAICTRKLGLPRLMLVLAFAHLSLTSMRNMPLFVIVSLPAIASLLATAQPTVLIDETAAEFAWSKPAQWLKTRWADLGARLNDAESLCTRHALPVACTIVMTISCFFGGRIGPLVLVDCEFDPLRFPSENLKLLEDLDPKHGLNLDNWGGYLRYKTGNRVFIDDRADFYGSKFYLDYAAMARTESNWRDLLEKYKIEWALFPTKHALALELKLDPDWKVAGVDHSSSLFVRNHEDAATKGQ